MYRHCKFVAVAGTECTDTTWANRSKRIAPGKSRLHGPYGRTVFYWYAGMKALVSAVGTQNVVHMHEFPRCSDTLDEQQMNRMLGTPVETNASDWNQAAERKRRWRTSPTMHRFPTMGPSMVRMQEGNLCLLPDEEGFMWHPDRRVVGHHHEVPIVARRHYVYLLEKVHQKTPLDDFEKRTVASYRVTNGTVTKHAGVAFFCHHLGVGGTFVYKHCQRQFPCAGFIHAVTLQPAQPNDTATIMCGQPALCPNCRAVIRCLGGSWHLPSAAEVLSRALSEALAQWLGVMPDIEWWQWDQLDAHYCGDACELNPCENESPSAD